MTDIKLKYNFRWDYETKAYKYFLIIEIRRKIAYLHR